MTTLREAAQQALEAYDAHEPLAVVMEALRTALAEPEQEPIGPEWKPCVKLPVTVHVREQRPGEAHVSTREGITPIRPDDLIMRGVAGEEYPIGRELFNRTYRLGEQRTEPEQEPEQNTVTCVCGAVWEGNLMVHAPRQRKPLTEPELHEINPTWPAPGQHWDYEDVLEFVRAIERAHGIGGEA